MSIALHAPLRTLCRQLPNHLSAKGAFRASYDRGFKQGAEGLRLEIVALKSVSSCTESFVRSAHRWLGDSEGSPGVDGLGALLAGCSNTVSCGCLLRLVYKLRFPKQFVGDSIKQRQGHRRRCNYDEYIVGKNP
jgi:hypothetical protein